MSRPLLWLRSWWLSHDKWQVLGVVDPVVNSHLRIVIMTTTLLLYTHHIAASMLVFPCRNGVGDILVYFHVSPWLPCLYGAFVAPEPGFLQQVSLPYKKKEGNGQRPAVLMLLIAFTECDIFVWMVSTFWGVLFLILFSLYLSRCTYTYVYMSRQIESIISGSVPRQLLGLEYSLALLLPPSILIRGILISIKIR